MRNYFLVLSIVVCDVGGCTPSNGASDVAGQSAAAEPAHSPTRGASAISAAVPSVDTLDGTDRGDTAVTPDHARAVEFIAHLKDAAGDKADSRDEIRFENPEGVLGYVSSSGVTFNDVNDRANGVPAEHLSVGRIREQLAAAEGTAFRKFAHLRYIAARPYPQYSRLYFRRIPGGVRVTVGNYYYGLTFRTEQGKLRLAQLDYLKLHDK